MRAARSETARAAAMGRSQAYRWDFTPLEPGVGRWRRRLRGKREDDGHLHVGVDLLAAYLSWLEGPLADGLHRGVRERRIRGCGGKGVVDVPVAADDEVDEGLPRRAGLAHLRGIFGPDLHRRRRPLVQPRDVEDGLAGIEARGP